MAAKNSGSTKHRQHFYGTRAEMAAITTAYKGDYYHELDENRWNYFWDGTAWIKSDSQLIDILAEVIDTNTNLSQIIDAMDSAREVISFKGIATGGSSTTIVDDTLNIETDILANKIIKVTIDAISYLRKVISNTLDTITIAAIQAAVAATAVIGESEGGQVTITYGTDGEEGNNLFVEFVNGDGNDVPLSADFTDGVLTITLATDENGDPKDATNIGTAVAGAIDLLEDFSAEMTGSGGVVVATAEPVQFSGGLDAIEVVAGCEYSIRMM